jgi:hypothetical protein
VLQRARRRAAGEGNRAGVGKGRRVEAVQVGGGAAVARCSAPAAEEAGGCQRKKKEGGGSEGLMCKTKIV